MVQPINYAIDIPDPSQAFLQAFKTGTAVTETRLAQEEAQRKAEQQRQIQGAFTRLRQPGATAKDYADLSMLLPETQAKAVRESFNMLNADQQQSARSQAGQVFSAFRSGRPEIAIGLIQRQIDAKRNSGDESGAQFLETWRDVAKETPTATEDYFGGILAEMPGGKDVLEAALKVSAERRTAAEAPAKLLEAQSKAREAEAKARVAVETATDDISRATALREFEQAKARKERADADVAAGTVQSRIAKAAEEAKPAPGFAIIPEAERASLGLPPGVYQRNLGTQKIEPVSKELVRIDMGQQRETLALKELDVPRAQEFSAAAASARTLARDSKVIADLLKGKGGGATVKLTADFAKTLGFESETVRANDLANSLAIRGATQLRPPGSGSTSDTEFKAFVSAFPSLANSEGGRELMAKYADAFATRSAKLADHARKLIREDRYSEEEIARFDTSLGAILKDDFYKRPGTGAPVTITLPNGQRATFPNQQAADAFKQRAGIQ
ncbi:hypothetical protein UFOVP416_30 [uncultured Caudovirales phage]|uniref:Uncharacterized protein n=1 Tax=uncultured Caudovirales phage TaxID=2100421 RepID=A0A6J5M883_9CAUD|nr:hypothetical protein UFOVP416_30 [uncultured Caudovirales phage]